jgi:hypothetical protein
MKPQSPFTFPPGVTEKVGSYVYVLLDPRGNRGIPFYVGKGRGDRAFAHARAALKSPAKTDKLDRIRAIRRAGHDVRLLFVRHQLDGATALAVEAAVIDLLEHFGSEPLTNAVSGHTHACGLCSADEMVERYAAKPLVLTEPALLLRISRRWSRGMPEADVYAAARSAWRVSIRRARSAKYVLAVAGGIVRGVYIDATWKPCKRDTKKERGRWEFDAEAAPAQLGWIGRSVVAVLPDFGQNPVRYVNT